MKLRYEMLDDEALEIKEKRKKSKNKFSMKDDYVKAKSKTKKREVKKGYDEMDDDYN